MTKKNVNVEKDNLDYGFYSNVLKKPFERLEDLKKAESVYFEEQKVKEDKAAQKRAEAKTVEDAFKALNAARREYKEKLSQLTTEYSEALTDLKKAYELGKKDLHETLAKAEESFDATHKEFVAAHPEGYHLTLRDGDFETTISGSTKTNTTKESNTDNKVFNLFELLFGLN